MAFWETQNRIELSEGNTLSLYCIKVFYMIRTTTRKQQQPQSHINSHFGAGEPVIPGK